MTESPAYLLEKKEDNFEIRRYPNYILAQVDVEAGFDDAIGIGFSILANYIFGGNKKRSSIPMTSPVSEEKIPGSEKIPMAAPVTQEVPSERIAMTVPVTEEKQENNIHRISFTMPHNYTLETLPEPNDDRIMFKEIKNQRVAVLKFSGRVKEKMAHEKIKILRQWLNKNDISPQSNFIVAQYNNPAVPGFLRRNEILVEI
ncbi:MAG: heme-binding protein [Methanobacteriaceae archaeon]